MAESILDLRARRLAERIEEAAPRAEVATVVLVLAGDERVGVPVSGLREIVRSPPITLLPHLPGGMAGLVQLHGELMTAVGLAAWLGLAQDGETSLMLVLDGPDGPLGLLAGEVLGFREILRDEVVTSGADGSLPVLGRTTDLVLVLDLERLFAAPELRVGSARSAVGGSEASR